MVWFGLVCVHFRSKLTHLVKNRSKWLEAKQMHYQKNDQNAGNKGSTSSTAVTHAQAWRGNVCRTEGMKTFFGTKQKQLIGALGVETLLLCCVHVLKDMCPPAQQGDQTVCSTNAPRAEEQTRQQSPTSSQMSGAPLKQAAVVLLRLYAAFDSTLKLISFFHFIQRHKDFLKKTECGQILKTHCCLESTRFSPQGRSSV